MLGEKIRDLRKQFGYSQQQLAMKMHITQGAVSQWENDLTIPAADQLLSLAEVFGVTVDDLLRDEEHEIETPVVSTDPWDVDAAFSEVPEDIRIMARGMGRLSPENRQTLLNVAKAMFKEDFDEEGNRRDP